MTNLPGYNNNSEGARGIKKPTYKTIALKPEQNKKVQTFVGMHHF